jgi:hypothetical protein
MQCWSPPPPRGKATLTGIRTRFQDFVKTCKCRTTPRNFSILTAISADRELDDSRKITQFFCPNLSENQFADFKPLVLVNRQHASEAARIVSDCRTAFLMQPRMTSTIPARFSELRPSKEIFATFYEDSSNHSYAAQARAPGKRGRGP